MRPRLLFMTVLVVSGCGVLDVGGPTKRELEVAPFKAGCTGLGPWLCLRVREVGEADFQNLFGTPTGFDYEWGFDYLIEVEEEEIDNPPADGSSIRRTLERVLSKTPVPAGSTFELLAAAEIFQPLGNGRHRIFHGEEEIECVEGPDCDGLAATIASGVRPRLTLRFPPNVGEPFVVVAWVACAAVEGPCGG